MSPRELLRNQLSQLHCSNRDPVLAQALGLVLSGALLLAAAVLYLIPKKIGA